MEQHVLDEVGRQVDYYVDAYREIERLGGELAELLEQVDDVRGRIAAQEELRDHAEEALNALVADIDDDESVSQVRDAIYGKMSGLVGTMVVK